MAVADIRKRKAEEEARNRSSVPVSSPCRQLLNFIGERSHRRISKKVCVCSSPFYVPTNLPFLRVPDLTVQQAVGNWYGSPVKSTGSGVRLALPLKLCDLRQAI